ncbi:MAG: hypothetical protein LWX56_13605 [Ignavibacteria bacterium]|nr:hypothetical protein [Ignavibacteria bacterium]
MAYALARNLTEAVYRQIFETVYCDSSNPIITHDGIRVKFFPDQFDHAFFESNNWQAGDKSMFSQSRAERIYWIKDTLQDPQAILKVGWDKLNKTYNYSRRVAVVVTDYVVIIHINNSTEAKFITAYKADKSIGRILAAPPWKI